MIRYYCDRCGVELTKEYAKEVLILHGTYRWWCAKKDRKAGTHVLCNSCMLEFETWLEAMEVWK